MKKITLCADDYGMHPSVSEAIIELAHKQSIQATSCLVTSAYWKQDAQYLDTVEGKIDIGLHLNFTEGKGLSASFLDGLPGLNKMLILSHLHLLNKTALIEEITAQYQAFCETMGRQPDFIDGHQHVHHLPMVREAIISVIRRFNPPESFWIRSVSPMISQAGISQARSLKSRIIELSGANAFRTLLKENRIETNSAFAGIYSLSPDEPYRSLMQGWLTQLPDYGLIMCHPGKINSLVEHTDARQQEFNYLAGEDFTVDCQAANVQLNRQSVMD